MSEMIPNVLVAMVFELELELNCISSKIIHGELDARRPKDVREEGPPLQPPAILFWRTFFLRG
jgi:hypothetical protein